MVKFHFLPLPSGITHHSRCWVFCVESNDAIFFQESCLQEDRYVTVVTRSNSSPFGAVSMVKLPVAFEPCLLKFIVIFMWWNAFFVEPHWGTFISVFLFLCSFLYLDIVNFFVFWSINEIIWLIEIGFAHSNYAVWDVVQVWWGWFIYAFIIQK